MLFSVGPLPGLCDEDPRPTQGTEGSRNKPIKTLSWKKVASHVARLILPWRRWWYVTPKRVLIFNGLHVVIVQKIVLSRFLCNYRRSLDWWIDLLTTYTHPSELQVITVLSLITAIYKSPAHAKSPVFIRHFLPPASNSGNSSASCVQAVLSQPRVQNSTHSTTAPTHLSLPSRDQLNSQPSIELTVSVRVRVTFQLAIYRQSDRLGYKPLETHNQ
jgi:hypothetical protein